MSLANATLPQFRIGTVASLTGLTVHQIRAWEKRYGTVEPSRSVGGDRLYSEQDLRRLSLLKALNDFGHAIGSTANLPHDQLERMLALHEERQATPREALHRVSPRAGGVGFSGNTADVAGPFLEAITTFDSAAVERELSAEEDDKVQVEFFVLMGEPRRSQ